MNLVEINGKIYDVIVISIERVPEVRQSSHAGMTIAQGGEEVLDPIGTYYTYNITFGRRIQHEKEFDELFECLTHPYYDGVWVNVVYNQTTIKYYAKFSISGQTIEKYDKQTGKVYWSNFTASFIPTKAQVLPQ